MKYWKCTVCGYIHQGNELPETCPLCKAAQDKFEEMPEEKGKQAKQAYEKRMAKTKAKQTQMDAGAASVSETTAHATGALDGSIELMTKKKAHPITVHMPNGLLPVAVLFLLLSFVFDSLGFAQASFYNLIVVVLAMPIVLFSGYADWQAKYGGQMTPIFKQKIVLGIIVILLCAVLVVWGLVDDTVLTEGNPFRLAFLGVLVLALGAATYAGHLGGKLVFGD